MTKTRSIQTQEIHIQKQKAYENHTHIGKSYKQLSKPNTNHTKRNIGNSYTNHKQP